MLKVFRDNLKYLSWILWVVIGLFVLFVFVDFGGGLRNRQQGGASTLAARVGDREVTREDFQRQYRQLENMYRQLYGDQFTPELADQMRLPLQALEKAVTEQILLAEAERMGLRVTDAEVRQQILDLPSFQNQQGKFIGEQDYKALLSQNGYTPASFETAMRQDLLRQKLQDVLRAGIYVSDTEVERAYREQVEKAKIRYIQLPRTNFAATAQATPAELQSYFNAHREDYKLPEQREGAYLLVEADQLRSQVQVTDQQLRQEYDAKKEQLSHPEQMQARHILVRIDGKTTEEQARAKLEAARKRVEAGADFGTVAGEVSEEPGAKERGGDLGWFGHGQMVKPFDEAVFAAQPGQIVGPVKTEFGLHLIQVTGKRPAGVTPFEEIKEQLRARLAFTTAQDLAQKKANELAAQLEKNPPKSPEDLAKVAQANPGVTSSPTGKFGPQDPITGLGPAPALSAAAFTLDKPGKVTQPVQVQRGWAVLWLSAVHQPRLPELADVEPRVRATLAGQRMQEQAVQRLQQAKAAGGTIDQIAAGLG
ncbi:MAG TPA: SurA N-terminal domain-containing protein, partial [Thermoanaerobaculia bacterium]|nr:SurA N-terminal domain-containing protein [Thermoanaerobaculia bacterium]